MFESNSDPIKSTNCDLMSDLQHKFSKVRHFFTQTEMNHLITCHYTVPASRKLQISLDYHYICLTLACAYLVLKQGSKQQVQTQESDLIIYLIRSRNMTVKLLQKFVCSIVLKSRFDEREKTRVVS